MTWQTSLLMALGALNLACIVAVIFVERKSPASTLAWVMVLIFLPVIGFITYVLFGTGFRLTRKKAFAMKQASDRINKEFITKFIEMDTDPQRIACSTSCSRMIRYLERDCASYYTDDNGVEIFLNGNEFFERMLQDIRAAKKHVHLLYYIIRNDDIGRTVVNLLTEKAREGLAVRVIYDSLGSLLATGKMFDTLRAAGGQVEPFSPLLATFSSHLRLNYRNHRKITVIDDQVGYVGGMNIGDEYLGRDPKLSPWRDTQLRLCGSSVSFLQERFILDWMYASGVSLSTDQLPDFFEKPEPGGNTGVQIVSSGPDTATGSIKNGLLEMLYSARRYVYIQTPYFTPDESFVDAMTIAARAGVDVRLMLPALKDHHCVQGATLSCAEQLLDAGIRVYLYEGFLHAKTMVFDGEVATVGSANIGNRSFTLNFEVNAFVYDQDFASRCEAIFLEDLRHSRQIDAAWYAGQSPLNKIQFSLFRLIAPLV